MSIVPVKSSANKLQASDNVIPLSLISTTSQRGSSSSVWQFDCMCCNAWSGIGARCCFASSSIMKVLLNILLIASPCSRVTRLSMDLTEENPRFTYEDDIPLANKWSLKRPASDISISVSSSCPKHPSR